MMSTKRLPKRKPRTAPRRRRSSGEARGEALAVARKLLITKGPDAVTLKAVADELGVSHTNILHHFGTASELQSELMSAMVHDLAIALMGAVAQLRSDTAAPRALIDIVFDAFDKGGAGRLAAWIALSGNMRQFEPVRAAMVELVRALDERFANEKGDPHLGVTSAVLLVALMAFGDSVIGEPLREMVDRERSAARKVCAFLLPKFFF
ncbi:MAG TPA: TetR/AcrR family transcriptional regulator [Rhizomicrobium sp.]|nr:TetR/AcrR family transcriptional regulator [Rhizomicrobium sp.]